MSESQPRDVVISSGHKNFHMLFTAAEMERRGRLSRLICGAYPTAIEKAVLAAWPLRYSRKLNRFVNRIEKVPQDRISQNRASEFLSSLARQLEWFGMSSDQGSVAAFHIYGHKSEGVLRRAAVRGARIYHYRAGFGQSSVAVAKEMGMLAICDHSIVHPSLVDSLVELCGQFPQSRPGRPGGIWGPVLDDIEAADLVLVNSDFVSETFRFMGFEPARLAVIYQGVEDKFLRCLPTSREFYATGTQRPIRLLFAGSIVPRKGVDEIAAVLAARPDARVEVHFAGVLSAAARTRYARLLADSRVRYHGMLSQSELALLMSQSDVFLFPSRAEGSARVIFEAMAAGCAVITTRNSGSVVNDGENGYLVPVGNQDALLDVLNMLCTDPASFGRMGRGNRALILCRYTQRHYGDGVEDVYERVLAANLTSRSAI